MLNLEVHGSEAAKKLTRAASLLHPDRRAGCPFRGVQKWESALRWPGWSLSVYGEGRRISAGPDAAGRKPKSPSYGIEFNR
jgi:hypothetical protein